VEVVIRRIRPNFFIRLYHGWKVGLSVVLGVCTVGGLYFALYPPQKFGLFNKLITLILIVIIGIFVAYLRGKQKQLPHTIIDELSKENSYSVGFCNTSSLREADEMTRPYFGRGFIPFDQIEQWRLINKKGFIQINNAEGVLCACFVILGLEKSFLDQFTAGRLTEHDIDSSVILPFESMKKQDRIYVSGVVVRNPHTYMGHKRATIMLWTMLQYIKIVFGLRKTRTFYALGLTNESEELLKTVGFRICGNKDQRKDNSNLYRIELDRTKREELLARIGNYSGMVSLHLE